MIINCQRKLSFIVLLLNGLFVFGQTHAQEIETNSNHSSHPKKFSPFFVHNVLPVSIGLGLPKTLSANSLSQGEKRLLLNFGVKSNANDAGSSNGEVLRLDGETYSLNVGLEYGLTSRWQFDAQISYLRHTAGSLDSVIDSWHDWFGLDEGDRPLFAEDQFQYAYSNGSTAEVINDGEDGISDLRLGLGYAIHQAKHLNLLVRAGVSLPTGNADKLTGSDDLDADVGFYANGRGQGRWQNLGWHVNLGYLFIGDEQSLGIATESGTWFSSLGAYWAFSKSLVFKTQLDSHGAFFDSEINELAQSANELTLGVAYQTKQGGEFEIYFSEDISVNRSADFSFGVAKKLRF